MSTIARSRTLRSLQLGLAALAFALVGSAVGCAVEPPDDETDPNDLPFDEETSQMDEELTSSTTKGDWSKFPGGLECLPAVQAFYPAKFGVSVPIAGPGNAGSCHEYGACKIWLVKQPDPNVWERIPNDGNHLPTTYDMIVYPPTATNPNGHIASVDHVEGKTIYVMDDNYVAHHVKASKPHTVATKAYGWYHLKKLGNSPPPSGGGGGECVVGGFYCGGDKVTGDPDTLFKCTADGRTKVRECSHGCEVQSGKDDACACVPGSNYCGGDEVSGDKDTLYKCGSDGVSRSIVKKCANGCSVNTGNDDTCKK